MTLQTGDLSPDLTLPSTEGAPIRLRSLCEKGPLVLYFYPKDETAGCTAEACSFRDAYEDFAAAGAQVVGVSGDSDASHQRFKSKHRLPFTLLTDEGAVARKAFGVKRTLGFIEGRVTFVIDRQGVIRHVFSSQVNPTRHVSEALEVIRGLDGGGAEEAR